MKFHAVGLKCSECGSYNTCRDDDPNAPLNPVLEGNLVENELEDTDAPEEEDCTGDDDDEDSEDDEHLQENDDNVVDISDDDISIQSDFSLD